MKTLLAAAAAVGALSLAAPALAQTHGSLGYSNFEVGPFDLDAVTGRFGWSGPVLGIEGEASVGVGDDQVGVNRAELNHSLGVFGTAKGQLNEDFAITGRVGYATAEAEVNGVSGDDNGLAYGAGMVWTPGGGANGLRFDYTKYDLDAVEADSWSIGLQRRF